MAIMLSNRVAFIALAVACVAAAAGGGYVATRQTVKPVAPATAVAVPEAPTQVVKPVQETEAVIGDTRGGQTSSARPAAAAEAPSAAPPQRKHVDAPSRAPAGRASRPADAATARNVNQLPSLERSWPSSAAPPPAQAAAPPAAASAPAVETPAPVPQVEERTAPEPSRAPDPPEKKLEELVVSADSVIGLQTETALSSETARVEDHVEASVVRDVRVGGSVAIPAGSRALGSVMVVDRGSKFRDRARLGIRFHTLVLADGTRIPLTTETIYRYGEAPGKSSATKIGGGAVVGAILGAIAGGAKGAAIGATAGAGAGTASVAVGDRSAATFPAGAQVTARILSPMTVTIEK
jgi:type IV secretory pathway VirB10-like protein